MSTCSSGYYAGSGDNTEQDKHGPYPHTVHSAVRAINYEGISIKFDDNSLTEKYGFIFITHSDYEDLLTKKDSGYNYYIVGSLCEALYCSNKKETAITLAFENTLVYSSVNPIRVVISLAVENGDINLLSTIKQKLESRENKNQSILSDITLITNYINERS